MCQHIILAKSIDFFENYVFLDMWNDFKINKSFFYVDVLKMSGLERNEIQ